MRTPGILTALLGLDRFLKSLDRVGGGDRGGPRSRAKRGAPCTPRSLPGLAGRVGQPARAPRTRLPGCGPGRGLGLEPRPADPASRSRSLVVALGCSPACGARPAPCRARSSCRCKTSTTCCRTAAAATASRASRATRSPPGSTWATRESPRGAPSLEAGVQAGRREGVGSSGAPKGWTRKVVPSPAARGRSGSLPQPQAASDSFVRGSRGRVGGATLIEQVAPGLRGSRDSGP